MSDAVRLPGWLVKPLSNPTETRAVRSALSRHGLTTVCEEARCPNRAECFSRGTATFMILGDRCTRNCGFCAVSHGAPLDVDPDEPEKVAEAAAALGLAHVVVTSVTRDDLPDGGAGHFATTVRTLRRRLPRSFVEVLVPDFLGDVSDLHVVLASDPDVLGHNMETVERLYGEVRPGADYTRSLDLLRRAAAARPRPLIKSSLMLGLGESRDEIACSLGDMLGAGVDIVTLGQYLRPSREHHPVSRFLSPEEFEWIRREGLSMGFRWVEAGPFVRSSYRAERAATALIGSRPQGRESAEEEEPNEDQHHLQTLRDG